MAAEGQREMRAQMIRLKTSVANAVSKRRFLFDQYKVDARKKNARKKYKYPPKKSYNNLRS
mgnify:CR=1 FL=1